MRGPQQLLPNVVCLSDAESARVRRLVVRLGSVRAAAVALGIGDDTLECARECGRMQRKTRQRILDALAVAEANQ